MTDDAMEMMQTPQAYPRLRTWVSGLAVGLVAATFAWVQVVPDTVETQAVGGGGGTFVPTDPNEPVTDGDSTGPQRRVIEQRVGGGGEDGEGATGGIDTSGGVTGGGTGGSDSSGASGDEIKLGATVVRDGIAKDFLGEVELGMDAVKNRVNSAGGVHGRQLEIIYKNDNWEPDRGQRNIESMIVQDEVFAFAVSPSSEGLNAASNAGLFKRHGVPVVGADGLNNTQFLDPFIWPVATATTTQAHVIMVDAWKRCQQAAGCDKLRPAIVFGNTYRFGVEGAFAFNGAYCRLTGGTFTASGDCNGGENIPGFSPGGTNCAQGSRFCGVSGRGGEQYITETDTLKKACLSDSVGGGKCNFVLLLLEPASALSWMNGEKFPSATDFERDGACCGMAGAQPLFTSGFANNCRENCDRMQVWTGYNPPSGYGREPAVQKYTQELQSRSSTADIDNQFTMGGYIGMTLLVEALERVGPDLTREKLIQTLNSMPPLKTGLTNSPGLRWTAEERYANQWAQSFRIGFVNQFQGFQQAAPYTADPYIGKDNRLP